MFCVWFLTSFVLSFDCIAKWTSTFLDLCLVILHKILSLVLSFFNLTLASPSIYLACLFFLANVALIWMFYLLSHSWILFEASWSLLFCEIYYPHHITFFLFLTPSFCCSLHLLFFLFIYYLFCLILLRLFTCSNKILLVDLFFLHAGI